MRISKKILACVLAALMAISMMPIVALADGNAVEYINANDVVTNYSTLSGPLKTGTYRLYDDVTASSVNVGSSMYKNQNVVLDLNGHDLTLGYRANFGSLYNGSTSSSLSIINSADTVANIICSEAADGYANISFKNGTLTIGPKVNITGSVFYSGNATVNVRGSVTTNKAGDYAISSNNTQATGTTLNIYDGAVVSAPNGIAIFHPEAGTFNMSGGTVSGQTGIYAKRGTINISGGTVIGTGAASAYAPTGSGANATGDALVLDNMSGYAGTLSANVQGGTFTSTNGDAVTSYASSGLTPVDDFVTGGTFSSDVSDFIVGNLAQADDGTVAALPTATLTDITDSTEYDVAYQFAANNDGEAFKNFKADFVVSVDKTVNTADVKLFGKFGAYDWTMFPEMTAEAGTEYYLARDAYNWTPTYEEICNDVGTFSCAVLGKADEATTLTVKLVIYKEGVEPIVINSFTHNIAEKALEDTMSITVADDINLNINVVTEDPDAHHIVYSFTNPDTEDATKTNEVTVAAKGDLTSFTVPLAPAQINDDITATVCEENGAVIREVTTSVADYCNTIIGMSDAELGTKAEELRDLAKATLDYGFAASNYFDYNKSGFSGYEYKLADPTDAINAAVTAAIEANGGNYINNAYGLTFTGVSYVAKSKPELRFYLNSEGVDIDEFEAKLANLNDAIECNIGTARFVQLENSGEYLLQIKNIDIADFGKKIEVEGYLVDQNLLEFTPLTWVKLAIADQNLSELGKGIGNYYLKAVGYFGVNA